MSESGKEKRKVGRPKEDVMQKVNELIDFKELVEFIESGATDKDVAEKFGISERTVRNWKANPEFLAYLKKPKEIADKEIVVSLYHKAKGYSHPEVKVFFDSKTGQVIEHEVVKHYPPDTAAAFIWLKNRQGKDWRDRHEIQVDGGIEHIHTVKITKVVKDGE